VSSGKNHPFNWIVLGAMMLGVSMFFALIPLFYFYTPAQVWAFVTFRDEAGLAGSLHYIYSILVAIIFVDIAFIRHFWCRFMCVYKVWQHGFKTKQTLHIEYDASRSEECVKCNLCATSCFLDLDPKRTDIYDTCINCGECVSACDMRQAKKGQPGLLRLVSGDGRRATFGQQAANALGNLSARLSWTLMIGLVGLGMFGWGVWSYQNYHLAVYRADIQQGAQINDYRIAVSNKLYHPAELSISVEGLAPQQYQLSSSTATFTGAERVDLNLHVTDMPQGLHRFVVHAKAPDGWRAHYRVQHFVGSES
jgi:polyferredoxin